MSKTENSKIKQKWLPLIDSYKLQHNQYVCIQPEQNIDIYKISSLLQNLRINKTTKLFLWTFGLATKIDFEQIDSKILIKTKTELIVK